MSGSRSLQIETAAQRLENAALRYADAPLSERQLVTGELERAAVAFRNATRDTDARAAVAAGLKEMRDSRPIETIQAPVFVEHGGSSEGG